MKTIFMILLMFGISFILKAQKTKSAIEFQKKEFNTYLKSDSTDYFSVSPKSENDKLSLSPEILKELQDKYSFRDNLNVKPLLKNNQIIEHRMPVANSRAFSMNMPVMVPDTSVHFYIKEKRIDYINPKERNSK